MNSDFELTRHFENGYFYTFEYYPKHSSVFYDKTPFVFCIGPVDNVDNLISGLNLHHISIQDRITLLSKLETLYNFTQTESKHLFSESTLNSLVPGIDFGFRKYNLRNMYNVYRVKNSAVPLYLHEQGNIYLGTASDKYLRYILRETSPTINIKKGLTT
jgi:hypothetical protein